MVPSKYRKSFKCLPHLVVKLTKYCNSLRYFQLFHILVAAWIWSWQYTSEISSLSASRLAMLLSCAISKRLERVFWCFDGFCSQLQVAYITKVLAGIWSSCLTVSYASFITALFWDVKIMRVELIRKWLIKASKKVGKKEIRLKIKMIWF